MHNKGLVSFIIFVSAVLLCATSLVVSAAEVPRISTDDLTLRLGDADLVVLDVRSNPDWQQSDKKIIGSERVNPGAADQWASHYSKEKDIVLYCA